MLLQIFIPRAISKRNLQLVGHIRLAVSDTIHAGGTTDSVFSLQYLHMV